MCIVFGQTGFEFALSQQVLLAHAVCHVKSSGWRRRRDWGEITDGADDDGKEFARISVSTGTAGGGERESSEDDPPDIDTFKEDVDFDINYQQNGRVIGTATNNEPGAGRSRRSGRKTSTTSKHTERHRRRGSTAGIRSINRIRIFGIGYIRIICEEFVASWIQLFTVRYQRSPRRSHHGSKFSQYCKSPGSLLLL